MNETGTPRKARGPLIALFAAAAISLVGNQLTALAIPWLVLTTIGTAFDTGVIGVAIVLPAVIGAIAGGVVIDRLGSRETSIVADLASAIAVAAVPITAVTLGLSLPLLFVLAFAGALLDAPGATARQVMLPDLAERAAMPLERANGILETITNLSFLFGPLIAGAVIVVAGVRTALWIDAATFVVSALVVFLWIPRPPRAATSEGPADVSLGIRLVARDPVLRALVLVCVLANFVGTPLFVVILPALALAEPGGAGSLGLMLAAFGGGLVAGSVGFGIRGDRLPRRWVLAGGFAVTGLGFAGGAFDVPLPFLLGALALAGLASGPINPLAFTLMQERVPAGLRGRAFGALLGGIFLGAPVGMLVMGELTRTGGPELAMAVAAVGFLAVGAAIAVRREFRDLEFSSGSPSTT